MSKQEDKPEKVAPIQIDGHRFSLVTNYREGWNEEAFGKRFSEILNKYDYIVGDWGYSQLRLKGFYANDCQRVPREMKIGYLKVYLEKYCNYGCAHFVLKRIRS